MRIHILWIVLFGLSCARVDVSSPEEVYREFYAAIAEHNWDKALMYLSHEAQDAIVHQRTLLNKALGGEESNSVFTPMLQAEVLVPLRTIEVISRGADGATIEVRAGSCDKGEPCMSRVEISLEGGRYVIAPRLPANFTESTQEGAR
jgi:hypothetical protein